jgi:hypothetical protein
MTCFKKKYFFGWENIKWFIKELLKVGSNIPSWFSQKRLHQGISFAVMQWGCIYWMLDRTKHTVELMPASEFFIWASIEAVVCGYTLNQIQKEKVTDNADKTNKVD